MPTGYYHLHLKAIYHFNKFNYDVESLVKSQNSTKAYLKKSIEKGKRTIPIVKTKMIQTSKDEIHKEVIFKNRKIPLRYGIIDLNRTITGYLKGNYNETTDKFETYNGNSISGWSDFHWKSRHSSVGIELPLHIIPKVTSESKSPIIQDSKIHSIAHVLVNASKILTKSESNDIDVYYENGIIYLYDNSSDGYNGCSKIIYDEFDSVLKTCNSLLNDCDCSNGKQDDWEGCPKCTFTTNYCQTKNRQLSKNKAKEFFSSFK